MKKFHTVLYRGKYIGDSRLEKEGETTIIAGSREEAIAKLESLLACKNYFVASEVEEVSNEKERT